MYGFISIEASQSFMPHGACYLWTPGLVGLHVISDSFIALAYIIIPIILLHIVRKRDDLPFDWMFLLFGLFIVACGATHMMAIWNVWHGDYWESGVVKAITALASVPTAVLLFRLVPNIISLPSRQQLKNLNTRLEDTNKELEQFVYAVSHDLRAPLRSIHGFSHALETEIGREIDDNSSHYLTRIRESSEQMGKLIDDLLDLSRLSRESIEREQVDLSSMAKNIIDDLHASDPQRDVEATIQPGMTANCDAGLLRVALDNLLRNAWKFTSNRDKAVIKVAQEQTPEGNSYFYVRDNGAGFDMRYVDKLFTVFQRLHTNDEFSGNGVGLATVQRIIHRHGGNIWAESRAGEGATFKFSLP